MVHGTAVDAPVQDQALPSTSWEILAGLRFFLAWVVACGHLVWFVSDETAFLEFFNSFGGKAAVIGFLLVSGYSIAASLHRDARNFYKRRFLRVYPLYFFAVMSALLLELWFSGEMHVAHHDFVSNGWLADIGNFFLVQTFLVKPIAFDTVVWSLGIECFYYLLAPLFLKLKPKYLMLLIAISSLSYLLPKDAQLGTIYFVFTKLNALQYLWPWLIGFICFKHRSPLLFFTFSLLGVTLVKLNPAVGAEDLVIVTYMLSFSLLIYSAYLKPPKALLNVLNYLGDLSYPLYLFQIPCFMVGYAILNLRHPVLLLLFTLLISIGAYHAIDVYLKRKFIIPIVNRVLA